MHLGTFLAASIFVAGTLSGCLGSRDSEDAPGTDGPSPTGTPTSGTDTTGGPIDAAACELDAVDTFAKVPDPGYPYGLAVRNGSVYVSTSQGYPSHRATGGERVYTFDAQGNVTGTLAIPTREDGTMGLADLAFDNATGGARVYVVDMNGRILRSVVGATLAEAEVYATLPEPYHSAAWLASMPMGLAFGPDGSAYVADDGGRIWKVPPGGEPTIWFEDPLLLGNHGSLYGPFGLRVGPDGMLYVGVAASGRTDRMDEGVVYRLSLGDAPQANDLHEFYRTGPASGDAPPEMAGIAFGASGNLYAALSVANEVAVIDPDGTEVRRIHHDLISTPVGLAFLGDRLLVADFDLSESTVDEAGWRILSVCVQESGLEPLVPTDIP